MPPGRAPSLLAAGRALSLLAAAMLALSGAALAACGGATSGGGAATRTTVLHCPTAPFVLPRYPMVLAGVSPTTAASDGSYRDLGAGQETVVGVGPDGARIELLRGVPNNDYAVSVFSHGPVPLETITVLGRPATLYPAEAVANVVGAHQGRVPFATGDHRLTDACSRWELRAEEVPDGRLAAYAEALTPQA